MKKFGFRVGVADKHTKARIGEITTPHGTILTPAFIPVGTQASVKSLTPEELNTLGVQMFFVNSYHTYLRPGIPVIKKFGGLHRFMGWNRPVITDSGGFQVFSLARQREAKSKRPSPARGKQLVNITEDGVEFRSHWDGSRHLFTPESAMKWQWDLGGDIHIAFDDCTPLGVSKEKAKISMERTHRWAQRSLDEHKKLKAKNVTLKIAPQALYGVVQGSVFKDLRQNSARVIAAMDFDGVGIGGVSVGESKKEMKSVLDWTVPLLPPGKPRHLLGVGEIDDIFTLVAAGIDTFDCVQPTRLGRMGRVYVKYRRRRGPDWTVDLQKAAFESRVSPIDPDCGCYTCSHFSAGYLHHLFRVRELLAYRMATIHNIHFVNTLVADIRTAIIQGRFVEMKKQWV